jgi:hypothetical protein
MPSSQIFEEVHASTVNFTVHSTAACAVPVLPHFQVKLHGDSSFPCVILAHHCDGCDYHTHIQGFGVNFVSLGILS